ncbi:TIGR04211 family SH3 domain-containing protein [Pseudoalteromonas fenneropenaei]|uniref:TIGR04211 family SH3 domain-containing protein n=1 Tax=Pseudoalteromonas fenneropenaei TaxID=1737459 RepID=A0ABV7CLD2_9GAMM
MINRLNMVKRCLLSICLLTLAGFSNAETTESPSTTEQLTTTSAIDANAYVMDDLYVYVHAGAGKNYRILGSVNAGSPIQILGEEQNGFFNILDDKGRDGWIESKFVTTEPGLRVTNSQLQQQLDNANQDLVAARDELPVLQTKLQELEAQNKRLQQTVAEVEAQKVKLQQDALGKKQQEQHLMLTYGGAIAFTGLLLGVILTLFLSRRKRYDGWA